MYIKDHKAHDKALAELEALIDTDPEAGTPESVRLIKVSNAVVRYESWLIDDGAPRRWLLQMPKGWERPSPTYPPTETSHARTAYVRVLPDIHARTGRNRRTLRRIRTKLL